MEGELGLNYDIRINCPKEIDITIDQFKNLSYYGIASLFCNYEVLFFYNADGNLEMYFHDWNIINICEKNHRFKNINWFVNEAAEIYHCTIPKDYAVIKSIEKYLSHLIIKK